MDAADLTDRYSGQSIGLRSVAQSSRFDLVGNIFVCIIPMLTFIEIEVVGRLFLSEILLLCMLPFLLVARGRLLFSPAPKTLLLLGLAWLLSQIVTDVIRDTPFEDWSRGWSKIIFLLLNFSAIYLYLDGKEKRFFWFAAGMALGQILAYLYSRNIYADEYPWKFGYGGTITLFAVLFLQTRISRGRKLLSLAVLPGLGMLNFYMDFRSLGLICLVAGGFMLAKQSNRLNFQKIKPRQVALLILLGGLAIYGISGAYDYGAGEGWFGEVAREKYLLQSSGEGGLLLGGRSEILAASQAVMDSPIIGHGSWAKDPQYVEMVMSILRERGYEMHGGTESELIPSHSYIFGAWVEAGVLGALFWGWALILSVRGLIAALAANLALASLIAFVASILMWNIPFSPFGAEARLYAAYYLSLMIFALEVSGASTMVKQGAT